MEYVGFLFIRNDNYGFGYTPPIWVLGPLGACKIMAFLAMFQGSGPFCYIFSVLSNLEPNSMEHDCLLAMFKGLEGLGQLFSMLLGFRYFPKP